MSWLFGKKKKTVDPNKEISNMRDTLELLQKRERLLNNKIEQEVENAKVYMKKNNKNGTLFFSVKILML